MSGAELIETRMTHATLSWCVGVCGPAASRKRHFNSMSNYLARLYGFWWREMQLYVSVAVEFLAKKVLDSFTQ
jgi:hypothetical protein